MIAPNQTGVYCRTDLRASQYILRSCLFTVDKESPVFMKDVSDIGTRCEQMAAGPSFTAWWRLGGIVPLKPDGVYGHGWATRIKEAGLFLAHSCHVFRTAYGINKANLPILQIAGRSAAGVYGWMIYEGVNRKANLFVESFCVRLDSVLQLTRGIYKSHQQISDLFDLSHIDHQGKSTESTHYSGNFQSLKAWIQLRKIQVIAYTFNIEAVNPMYELNKNWKF